MYENFVSFTYNGSRQNPQEFITLFNPKRKIGLHLPTLKDIASPFIYPIYDTFPPHSLTHFVHLQTITHHSPKKPHYSKSIIWQQYPFFPFYLCNHILIRHNQQQKRKKKKSNFEAENSIRANKAKTSTPNGWINLKVTYSFTFRKSCVDITRIAYAKKP